jgi:hypothetical protein
MAQPVAEPFAQRLYDALAPAAYEDERLGWHMLYYLSALAAPYEEIESLARDTDDYPGWSEIVDVNRAKAKFLPWLGQMAGTTVPPQAEGESDATYEARVRPLILGTAAWKRGTPAALRAAAQQYLTGTKTVYFYERNGGAYKLAINTRKLETPVDDWAATNLCRNGGAESNVTFWASNNGVITRETSYSRFGLACFKGTAGATGGNYHYTDGTISGATAGRVFAGSVYVRGIGSTIGKVCNAFLSEAGGAQGESTGGTHVDGTVTLTANWQRLVCTRVITQNDRTIVRMYVQQQTSPANGDILLWDGAQIEENPQATPYIETNGATASRAIGQGPVGRALRAAKPAGLNLTYGLVLGWDFFAVDAAYASFNALDTAHTSFNDLQEGP